MGKSAGIWATEEVSSLTGPGEPWVVAVCFLIGPDGLRWTAVYFVIGPGEDTDTGSLLS